MKKKNKFARYGGMLFFIIFVICSFVINTGILLPKYETLIDTKDFPVIYSKDNTLYIAPLTKQSVGISDFLTVNENTKPITEIADSGNAVYFFENYDDATKTGSLFVTYNGKDKLPISSKAYKNIYISADGKTALYAENPDLENMSAKLYTYKKGEKKALVSEKADINSFFMDKKSGHVFYTDFVSGANDLYFKNGKSSEKIDSEVRAVIGVPDGNSVIYTKNSGDVYYWQKSKQPQKISSSASEMIISPIEPQAFLWCTAGDDFASDMYVFDNQPIKLDDNVKSVLQCDPKRANVLYSKNFNPENFTYDVALIYKGGMAEKLTTVSGDSARASASNNFSQIAYIENGNLYIVEKGLFAEDSPILAAENVKSFKLNKSGNATAYISGDTLYLRYRDEVAEISSGVTDYRFTNDGNTLCYIANYNQAKNSGNLYTKNVRKLNKDSEKIDSDVTREFYARGTKSIVYIKNYNNDTGEGELCVFRNGKNKTIDSGKIRVLCEKY